MSTEICENQIRNLFYKVDKVRKDSRHMVSRHVESAAFFLMKWSPYLIIFVAVLSTQ